MKPQYLRSVRNKKTNIFATAAIKELEPDIHSAWSERDMEKVILLLNKILELAPRNSDAHLLIGRAQGMQYEYDKAIEAFDKAVELAPQRERMDILSKAANMASNFYDPSIAETFFEEAVELAGTVTAKLSLADYSLRIRKSAEAMSLVDEVLKTNPNDPAALLLWCRLNEDHFEKCVNSLKKILHTQKDELKAKAGYQLAKMLDRSGDYDGAMQALASAKAILMPSRDLMVQNRVNIRKKLMELARGFTPTKCKEWKAASAQLCPTRNLVLLGGHPRSGTTLLEQVLDSHPEIISAEETDNFFMFGLSPLMRNHPPNTELSHVLDACSIDDLLNTRERYFTSMERCLGESIRTRILIDKNPSLTSLVPAMFRIFPEIKYVMMMRDPRDVVLSCYMQSFVPISSISGNYLTLEDTASEYASVMSVWFEARERFEGNFFELRYEDMVDDLEKHARNTLGFLGVKWSDSVMEYDRHAREKVVRSPTSVAVTEKVHKRAKARWKNYEKYLEPVYESLSPYLKALGYD